MTGLLRPGATWPSPRRCGERRTRRSRFAKPSPTIPRWGGSRTSCRSFRRAAALVDHFDLPDEARWDDFYPPVERQIEKLWAKYAGDAEALAALDEVAKEPAMHRRSGHHYGYNFFVARRV